MSDGSDEVTWEVYYRGETDREGATPDSTFSWEVDVDRERDAARIASLDGIGDNEQFKELMDEADVRSIYIKYPVIKNYTEGTVGNPPQIYTKNANNYMSLVSPLQSSEIGTMEEREAGATWEGTRYISGQRTVDGDSSDGSFRSRDDLFREVEFAAIMTNYPPHMRKTNDSLGEYMGDTPRADGSVNGAPGTFLDSKLGWQYMTHQSFKTWNATRGCYENPATTSAFNEGYVQDEFKDPRAGSTYVAYPTTWTDLGGLYKNDNFANSTVKCMAELVRIGLTVHLSENPEDFAFEANSIFNETSPRTYFLASHMFGSVTYNKWVAKGLGARILGIQSSDDADYDLLQDGSELKSGFRQKIYSDPGIVGSTRGETGLDGFTGGGFGSSLDDAENIAAGGIGGTGDAMGLYSFQLSHVWTSDPLPDVTIDGKVYPAAANSLRNYFRWSTAALTVYYLYSITQVYIFFMNLEAMGYAFWDILGRVTELEATGMSREEAQAEAIREIVAPYDAEFGTDYAGEIEILSDMATSMSPDYEGTTTGAIVDNPYDSPVSDPVEIPHYGRMMHFLMELRDDLEDPSPLPRSMKTKLQKARPIRMSNLSSLGSDDSSYEPSNTGNDTSGGTSGGGGGY